MKHILSARQFNRIRLEKIFSLAEQLEQIYRKDKEECFCYFQPKRYSAALIFFEPSTRTHMSFKRVFDRFDFQILYDTISAAISSSAAKGESVENSFYNMYRINQPDIMDIIVLRHPDDDAAERAVAIADQYGSTVINAGSGKREHPTQMLLDLFTIHQKRQGQIDGTKIVFGGDPFASRTIHSLVLALSLNYDIPQIGICGPTGSTLPDDILGEIESRCEIINFATYAQALEWQPDFVYATRPQIERYLHPTHSPEKKARELVELIEKFRYLQIDHALVRRMTEIGCFFMHPQPVDSINFNEILPDLITHPNSLLLQQAANGVWIRMAVVVDILA